MTALSMRSRAQIALIAAGLIVLVILSTAPAYMVNLARNDQGLVIHTVEVENQVAEALLQMRRAESAERGYLLTSRAEFIADYQIARDAVLPAFRRIRDLTLDNPVQVELIGKILPLVEERVAEFDRVIDLAREQKIDEAKTIVDASSGRAMTNRVRDLADQMTQEESRLLAIRTGNASFSQMLAMGVTVTGSALLVVIAAISIFLVQRSTAARDVAEKKLRDNNANLETIVERRTADLREANEEIQRFAYIVSHDLRSPLVNIMGFTSELDESRATIFGRLAELTAASNSAAADGNAASSLSGDDQRLMDDVSEAIGFIKSSIGKMDRLINAILQLTREGRREFRPEAIDMDQLMAGIAATVAHQASEANATIRIEPLPRLVSDRLALEQIFSNLIDNALKYLKAGVDSEIRMRGRNKLGYVIYDVIDNGRGIDPKDHERIFDLFRRAGAQDRPGQGIGLAHVRALVRRLGGAMSLSSELDLGSTFTVMLPAHWITPAAEERPPS